MSFSDLDVEHLASFKQAIINLLSLPTIKFTYTQIINRMPTSDTYTTDHWFYMGFPVLNHKELCPSTINKARAFQSKFDINSLTFKPKASKDWLHKVRY